jgi:hypothetical protein
VADGHYEFNGCLSFFGFYYVFGLKILGMWFFLLRSQRIIISLNFVLWVGIVFPKLCPEKAGECGFFILLQDELVMGPMWVLPASIDLVVFVFWVLTRFCVDYVELILKDHDPIVP